MEPVTLPISYTPPRGLRGATWDSIAGSYSATDPMRQVERASIRAFMEKHQALLSGSVLDFGCGKMPYRDLMQGGHYIPFEIGDSVDASLGGPFDAIMCNQVLQYIEHVPELLKGFATWLRPGGHLILTYPTNWDEVEACDLWRFTKSGMEMLLRAAGLSIVAHELRARVSVGTFYFPLGYGCVARK